MDVTYYSLVEKGKRAKNEDAVITMRLGPNTFFFAVADGMGGVKGGDIASNLILDNIKILLEQHFTDQSVSHSSLKFLLEQVFHTANKSLAEYIKTNPEYNGMGTTLAALLIHEDQYVWGNIGDSRIYVSANGDVCRITNDHNMLEDKQGSDIPSHYAIANKLGNVLTRVIDGSFENADLFPAREPYRIINNNTIWIICSDGLIINKAEDYNEYLGSQLNKKDSLKTIAQRLVREALKNGSSDNISVILVKAQVLKSETSKETIRIKPNKRQRKGPRLLLIAITALAIIALGLFVLDYFDIISLREISKKGMSLINIIREKALSILQRFTG